MAWAFVCPASRGIGFALAQHLLQTTKIPIIATARKDVDAVKASILHGLYDVEADRLTVLEVDITDESTISSAAAKAKALFPASPSHLRLVFAVPGILYPEKSPSQVDSQHALDTFRINTLGPLLLMKYFYPFLPKKKFSFPSTDSHGLPPHAVWTTMSARVGSTSDNNLGGWYSYRASKAAVNSLTKTFDLFLRNGCGDNAISISLHPGTVKTGLSKEFWGNVKEEKLFAPPYAAQKLVQVASTVGLEGRGRCWDWKGVEILP